MAGSFASSGFPELHYHQVGVEGSCILCFHEYISFHWIESWKHEEVHTIPCRKASILISFAAFPGLSSDPCSADPHWTEQNPTLDVIWQNAAETNTSQSKVKVAENVGSPRLWKIEGSGLWKSEHRTLPFADVILVAKSIHFLIGCFSLIFFTSCRSEFRDWDEDRMIPFWFITMLYTLMTTNTIILGL